MMIQQFWSGHVRLGLDEKGRKVIEFQADGEPDPKEWQVSGFGSGSAFDKILDRLRGKV